MALRRYSEFYSNSYNYGNKCDTIRTTYAVLRAASKQHETGKKENKLKSHRKKGRLMDCMPITVGISQSETFLWIIFRFSQFHRTCKSLLNVQKVRKIKVLFLAVSDKQ